jgi:hypothetical protein
VAVRNQVIEQDGAFTLDEIGAKGVDRLVRFTLGRPESFFFAPTTRTSLS